MILRTLRAAALGATILAVGGAGVAIAQSSPPPKHGETAERHMHRDPAAMMQHHAQHLRDALQLTPAQEPALQALLAAMKPPEGAPEHKMGEHEMGEHRMGEHMKAEMGEMAHMTTPQRLDRMRTRMSEHMARFDQMAQAVQKFYAQLTPSQQKAFDAMPPMMMHHEMGGHEMGHHDRGGHEG